VEPVGELGGGQVVYYQTSLGNDTDRLSRHSTSFVGSTGGDWQHIELNVSMTFQNIIGFGGAFTDASAINAGKMQPELQEHIINAYYSPSGLEYSIGRIPIAACDFSTHVYSYDDLEDPESEDLNLTHFSVKMDEEFKIPFIKKAIAAVNASQKSNPSRVLNMFASPWQSPLWMTVKNSSLNAKLKGVAGDATHKAFANYFSKFITAYQVTFLSGLAPSFSSCYS
jgi:glucosylceramidase